MQYSSDGGKTFSRMNESEKHVDNHLKAARENDPNYILVGYDGGLYESFDKTKNWKFIDNLPLTQFYKIAVDDDYPFYNVYGGTQDNNTQGEFPQEQTIFTELEILDWFILLGGDGHQPAIYLVTQILYMSNGKEETLIDTIELLEKYLYIKPQPKLGEKTEKDTIGTLQYL